jgi:exopolyphosphatase/guanosine-5'-triphosphate,3'-diphosphate pyrophosphatase
MRLISEEAEAQLSFLGVASRHATRRDWLMVDLGGGSTEVVAGQGGRITRWVSLRLGSGVLGSELSDPPRGPEIDDLKRKARLELERTPDRRPVRLVATGGTASNLPRLLGSRERKELSATDLERCRHRLGESRADEVARRHQLSEQRVLALRGGVEILLLLLERYDLDRFRITHEGLRHGMILAYRRRGEDWYLPS